MKHLLVREGLSSRFEVDSAGTAGYHIGKSPDSRMIAAGRRRGIKMEGRARKVRVDDFEEFDWIFAMDRSNFEDLSALQKQCRDPRARLVLFCDFCEGTHPGEVPDPYCGGPEDFEEVLDLLEDGCTSFLRRWQSGDSHENPGPVAEKNPPLQRSDGFLEIITED